MSQVVKWVEVALEASERATFLAKTLTEMGVANELTIVPPPPEGLPEFFKDLEAKFDQIRFSSALGSRIMSFKTGMPLQEKIVQACDALVKQDGKWWPRSFLFEALSRIFKESNLQVDLHMSALMIGTGSAARVATAALFNAGLKNFLVTAQDMSEAEAFAQRMKKHLLGVHFEMIPAEQLVMLTGRNGVVVNATPVRADNPILAELLYFNFIRQDGLVWDFSLAPLKHAFVDEAGDLGLNVTRGFEMAARVDGIWVERVFDQKLDLKKYQEGLLQALSSGSPATATKSD